MVKFKPGIPTDFRLDVKPVLDLGDYLDEPGPVPIQQKTPRDASPAPKPQAMTAAPARSEPTELPPAAEPAPPAVRVVAATPPSPPALRPAPAAADPDSTTPAETAARPKSPRREITMTPDTLRMSDELLDLIRGGSGQRDTKANELFHALVLLVHEARGELDTHTIPKRGQWGTPTARAYPLELKNAFLQAILKKYAGLSDSPSGLRYPVNTAA